MAAVYKVDVSVGIQVGARLPVYAFDEEGRGRLVGTCVVTGNLRYEFEGAELVEIGNPLGATSVTKADR